MLAARRAHEGLHAHASWRAHAGRRALLWLLSNAQHEEMVETGPTCRTAIAKLIAVKKLGFSYIHISVPSFSRASTSLDFSPPIL